MYQANRVAWLISRGYLNYKHAIGTANERAWHIKPLAIIDIYIYIYLYLYLYLYVDYFMDITGISIHEIHMGYLN